MPFGRLLKVGGKSENKAKLIVVAAEVLVGLTVTTKVLSTFDAVDAGFRVN